jgi:glutathione transport system permease protein
VANGARLVTPNHTATVLDPPGQSGAEPASAPNLRDGLGGGRSHRIRLRSRGAGRVRTLSVRTGQAGLTLWASSVVVWALTSLAPGDPAQQVLSSRGVRSPTRSQILGVHHELGLDQPLVARYLRWLAGVVHGDFGTSYISGLPVRTELGKRIGATLILATTAQTLVTVTALVLGLVAAATAGRWPDVVVRSMTVVTAAVPTFVVGLFLIQIVIVKFGLGSVIADGGIGNALLPATCVAVGSIAVPTRVLRGAIITAMGENYALVARARGARPSYVLLRHGLPNALIPFINALALSAAYMIGGTVVAEAVFTWPGVGSYLVTSVQQRDLPVVQAGVLLATLAYVVASFVADLLAVAIDPRTGAAS